MIRLLVAAEDSAGNCAARHVADLRLGRIEWLGDLGLEHARIWLGFHGEDWLPLKRVRALSREQHPSGFFKLSGRFDGVPGAPDALSLRMLFTLLAGGTENVDVLIVARDIDGADRRRGFEQARNERTWPFRIVSALAQPEVEAWLVATWEPATDAQREVLEALRAALGFDPVLESHRLTSTSKSRKDAKEVRARLDASGLACEATFEASPIEKLAACGERNGLATYLRDLDCLLVPLFGGHAH